MLYIFIVFILSILAILVFMLVRNEVVYKIRIKSIKEDQSKLYDNLPSYDIMMYSPTQWFMWTFKHYKRKYTK